MNTTDSFKDIVSSAMNAFLQKDYEESIHLFDQALSHKPAHRLSLLSRGSAFMSLNRLDEASADFDRAIEAYPDHARAYHLRGLVKEKQGDDLGAIADFDTAIELDVGYGAAYASRAGVHQKLGHTELASKDMETVVALTKVNLETYNNENNVIHSRHMQFEDTLETELNR